MKKDRPAQTLRKLRKSNMKTNTLINEIKNNIKITNKEISERKKKANS